MPKNPVRAHRKREQIRQGALRVFLSSGYVGSSMDQVAAAGQVSKQTLYAYYRSKSELLVDVLATLIGEVTDPTSRLGCDDVATRDGLRSTLIEFADALTRVALRDEYLALVRVILSELPAKPELGELWVRTVPARGMARLGTTLAGARDAGVLDDVDLDLATRLFVGPLLTFVVLDGLARPGDVVLPKRARLEGLVDLYLRAVTPPESS